MSEAIHFPDYEISEFSGYAQELPDSLPEYYRPWHELANKTANLIASQTVKTETEKLPLLDSSKLQDFKDLRLAHLQLCIITSGYAWESGPHNVVQSIPASVAIPLCDVSDRLGVQPGMSYFALLGNWQRVDKNK
ncbi:unnamed protein product [Lymnaea stagnalis]|uniref:Indoleamine 2,3-dioxygenase n=1 Tax=Lymnaea stagnalis TaxID=6523 RepID=A0AAV2GZ00_LYMST